MLNDVGLEQVRRLLEDVHARLEAGHVTQEGQLGQGRARQNLAKEAGSARRHNPDRQIFNISKSFTTIRGFRQKVFLSKEEVVFINP